MSLSVRVHGRGGQGVVTAAELLSMAAFDEGLHAQALPTFGSERTGAPVVAGCRIDDRPIRSHDPITSPDVVVVQDPTLLRDPAVLAGLAADGVVVVNTGRPAEEVAAAHPEVGADGAGRRWFTLPATELAREVLGRPLPNTALLGAVAAVTHALGPDSVRSAIERRFADPAVAGANVELARRAYAFLEEEMAR